MGTPGNAETAPATASGSTPLPRDLVTPQLTVRALLTGMTLGALLSACNIYTGLTIGWGTNMSITGVLLSYAFWGALERGFGTRKWTLYENNLNQVGCSAGAAVSSAGLVAPIPALTMLTGQALSWPWLALWVFSVCIVGITVAIPMRRQMIVVDRLPFPTGMAVAELLREMYARGAEALARVKAMLSAALIAALIKLIDEYERWQGALLGWTGAGKRWNVEKWGLPVSIGGFSAKSLTFSLDPTLLMVGVGGLIGWRAAWSLLLGAVFAWLVLAPPLIHRNCIRLTARAPLPQLAPDIRGQLKPQPHGFAKYHEENRVLEYSGAMSLAERDALLALSDDPRFVEAVQKLYVNSQLELAAPLPALPAAAQLAGLPVRFDPSRQKLIATAAIDRATHARLIAMSEDVPWRLAVSQLHALFQYTTTRGALTIESFGPWPAALTIPREAAHQVRYERMRQRLICEGRLSPVLRARLHEQAERAAQESPHDRPRLDAFKAAVDRLDERSSRPLLPDLVLPPELRDVVQYDESTSTFVARGVLGNAELQALRSLRADDAEFAESIQALVRGSRYTPVQANFTDVVQWLLWPGVTLMVISSLVSFAFSWKALLRTFRRGEGGQPAAETGDVPAAWFTSGLIVALVLSVALQVYLFQIGAVIAAVGVLLTFALALVAGRVSGETNTTPVGAMGKVTQLIFGVLVPNNPAPNLMAANVTGGAASQAADLLHDLKTGHLIGATPWKLVISQYCGALAGALFGSAVYLVLIPHPAEQLLTETWPAPAVATWKAVAELFTVGIQALPAGAAAAMVVAGCLGVVLPILERTLPARARAYVPSPASVGLALVINGFNSLSMFIGAVLAIAVSRAFPRWSPRFLVSICAGIIAGESLTGVGISIEKLWS